MSNIYKATPRQARKFLVECMQAGLVPYIHGSPGIGKSVLNRSVANEFNLHLIDTRLSTMEPTDLTGLPNFQDGRAYFAPFKELFPLQGDIVPEKKDGWYLFFDEFPSAPRSVQAAAYKVILDRMIGQHRLHERVVVAAAGNLMSDRAIVNPLSTAMQSRLVHIEMEVSFDEWLEDVAFQENYDPRIIAFLNQFPDKLMDFRPDHQEKTFACPRTWEFVNRLIKGKNLDDDSAILLSGTVTPGVAMEFYQFSKIYGKVPNIRDIVKDPENCLIPEENALKWATATHVVSKLDNTNYKAVTQYMDRFDLPFRILYHRMYLAQKPEFREHPEFRKVLTTISQYLFS